jgi:quinol-cytochrome oxidoreductase complex cytochrome b subunit
MKLSELTDLYVQAKAKLEAAKPTKRQKAVEGISLGDELIRDGAIIAFLMGAIFLLISLVPPPLHPGYDMTKPPRYVKPDWYLLWSLGPIFLAKWPIGNPLKDVDFLPDFMQVDPLVDTKFLGTILVNVAFVAIMVIPFVAKGKAMRPIESPTNAAMGVFGMAFIWWMSIVGIADILFAYEVQKLGTLHLNWLYEAKLIADPGLLINYLGILTFHQTLLCTWITYWALKRHRPKYESKLNATYYKVR